MNERADMNDTTPPAPAHVLADYIETIQRRMLQDIWLEADRAYWLRRARTFAAVGTPACNQIAQACRNRATLTLWDSDDLYGPLPVEEADR